MHLVVTGSTPRSDGPTRPVPGPPALDGRHLAAVAALWGLPAVAGWAASVGWLAPSVAPLAMVVGLGLCAVCCGTRSSAATP